MIALVLLLAVIGVIVYSSRKARRDYVVSIASEKAGETWTYNVRDMTAELRVASTGELLESAELRRAGDGQWERAENADATPSARAWMACDDATARAIETKHRSYNDGADLS